MSNVMMLKERERFDALIRGRGWEPHWAEVEQFLSEQECLRWAGKIDGWLAGDDRITRAVLEASLPRLKVIAKWGTGMDSIDLDAARELGVPVLNSPGAFSTAVAEVAMGYMLMLARHLGRVDRAVRQGQWLKPQGCELWGKHLGMIGLGAIGAQVAAYASVFGMRVRYVDPGRMGPVALPVGAASPAALEDIAASSDYVCLACPATPENHHLIDARFLGRMKKSAYVINVGRGSLIDEPALIEALSAGSIAGAGLDVYEVEPLPADSPLRAMDCVVLGSHNANNGLGAVESVHERTLDNLARHLMAE